MKLYLENIDHLPAALILSDEVQAPVGYVEKTNDLLSWRDHAKFETTDYLQLRAFVQVALNNRGWADLSNEEKDYVLELHINDENLTDAEDIGNKATFLITSGRASNGLEVRNYISKKWSYHHVKEIESSVSRLGSQKLFEVVGNYLSTDDGADLFTSINQLFAAFKSQAIKGTRDGVSIEGLFDYLESTPGSVYEDSGLSSKGYVMQNGDPDDSNFIVDLMDVLRNGNY